MITTTTDSHIPGSDTGRRAPPLVQIVDDDHSVRVALAELLESADFTTRCFESAQAFLEAETPRHASCVLLDMRLEKVSGLDVQASMRARRCETPIIFMTGHGTIPMTVQAMKGGAVEFLTKPIADDVLIQAVRTALAIDAARLEAESIDADLRLRFNSLTPREREVMALAVGGLMNKQLAAELGTSEITAKVHKRHVMEKMGARSLADLVLAAEKLGVGAAKRR
jgi:FixJ family two-component response regulator